MNNHLVELLSVIGPGLCYALLAIALLGLRSLFKGFENVLRRNAEAHDEMLARISEHETRLADHSARLQGSDRERDAREMRENTIMQAIATLGERVSRLEAARSLHPMD